MLGKLHWRCERGCCRIYGYNSKGKKMENRACKRRERQQWKKEQKFNNGPDNWKGQ